MVVGLNPLRKRSRSHTQAAVLQISNVLLIPRTFLLEDRSNPPGFPLVQCLDQRHDMAIPLGPAFTDRKGRAGGQRDQPPITGILHQALNSYGKNERTRQLCDYPPGFSVVITAMHHKWLGKPVCCDFGECQGIRRQPLAQVGANPTPVGFDIMRREQGSVAHLDEALDAFRPPDVRKWTGTRPRLAIVSAPDPVVATPFRGLVLLVPFLENGIRRGHLLQVIGGEVERRRPRGVPVASLEAHEEVAVL